MTNIALMFRRDCVFFEQTPTEYCLTGFFSHPHAGYIYVSGGYYHSDTHIEKSTITRLKLTPDAINEYREGPEIDEGVLLTCLKIVLQTLWKDLLKYPKDYKVDKNGPDDIAIYLWSVADITVPDNSKIFCYFEHGISEDYTQIIENIISEKLEEGFATEVDFPSPPDTGSLIKL